MKYDKNYWMTPKDAHRLGHIVNINSASQKQYARFVQMTKSGLYVNVGAIERRKEFNKRIKYLACCNYYILAEHMTDSHIGMFLAKYLGGSATTWGIYIGTGGNLFSPILGYDTIGSATVNDRLWKFYRATRCLIRCILRRWGKGSWEYNKLIKDLYK